MHSGNALGLPTRSPCFLAGGSSQEDLLGAAGETAAEAKLTPVFPGHPGAENRLGNRGSIHSRSGDAARMRVRQEEEGPEFGNVAETFGKSHFNHG